MLLSFHVVAEVAVVMLRKSELHDDVDVVVLGVRLFLQIEQIVERVVEENVSLDDFVALDVELVFGEDLYPVVVELLAINQEGLVLLL